MINRVPSYFWDTCVFTAFLMNQESIYDVRSIQAYLEDASRGRCVIYTSTLVLAEILPSTMPGDPSANHSGVERFLGDLEGIVLPVSPDPSIMTLAARLRDLPYKKNGSNKRRLGTPDAIMLATALSLIGQGVDITEFHTFDNGGKRDLESLGGKCIPLLTYQEWCDDFESIPFARSCYADKVINLKRARPVHPSPGFDLGI